MKVSFFIFRIILYTFIFLGIFNLSYAETPKFNYNAKNISNYFSGLVSFDNFDYEGSQKFFKKLEKDTSNHSSKFIQSLTNLEKYDEVYRYSKKLEKQNTYNFESNLFLGLHEFKGKNYSKAQFYFDTLEPNFEHRLIFDILKVSLSSWSKVSSSKNKSVFKFKDLTHPAYDNLIKIQTVFGNCYLGDINTKENFEKIFENKKYNFSRYNFFFANYLSNNNQKDEAIKFINLASEKYPGNLLINQFKKVLSGEEENRNEFNCQNSADILAEMLYVIATLLSSQEDYNLSNFYANLSKFLNPKFLSYNSLLAENFFILNKNHDAKKIYKKLSKIGSVYKWYGNKQIARIMNDEKDEKYISFLLKAYKDIDQPNIYQTFDLANFFRNNEDYQKSIELYSEILLKIKKNHKLFPKILERRGMAYERIDNWKLSEKDLLMSLEILPNEPYVMNYLAYSWVEKNKNVETALEMLRKANDLKKNNGYITDSLGWALYKLKDFSEAKEYLKQAIMLMPGDPVINDHFADCLWMNNYKIQARYYWKNVLKMDSAEEELKREVEKKLLFGLKNI